MLHRSSEQNNRRNNVRGGGLSALTSLTWLVRRLCVGQTLSCCLSVRAGTPGGDDETAVFVTTRTSPRFPSLNSSRSSIFVEPWWLRVRRHLRDSQQEGEGTRSRADADRPLTLKGGLIRFWGYAGER